MEDEKGLEVAFYRSGSDSEPVRDWIRSLSTEDRRVIGFDLRLVEIGWPIGMPLCRPLGNGLWEVRSNLGGNRISRVIFCAAEGKMVLLHAFIKKTREMPDAELRLAKAGKKEVERG
jgi:phage-related protein